MIDRSGDGVVKSTELMHMLINLGEEVTEELVEDMVKLVDVDGDGQIDFEEFFKVMCGKQTIGKMGREDLPEPDQRSEDQEVRHMSTVEMRKLFDQIDTDKSGYLDQYEVKGLAALLGKRMKKRHLVDAMKAMDPEKTDRVTFDMFRNWLLDAGRHWSELLVLPEASVLAIRQKVINVPSTFH